MTDPFKARIAADTIDQSYLSLAYDKWRKRRNRQRSSVVVFIHRNGSRRHRILSPGSFCSSMIRVGESAHQLAQFDRTGGVYIEPELSTETEWYREFIKQYEPTHESH
jgi:hypothetical protein